MCSCASGRQAGRIVIPSGQNRIQEVAVVADVLKFVGLRHGPQKFEASAVPTGPAGREKFTFPQDRLMTWTVARVANPVEPGLLNRFSCFHGRLSEWEAEYLLCTQIEMAQGC